MPVGWRDPGRIADYLSREIPHRDIAEAMLLQLALFVGTRSQPARNGAV